MVVWGVTQRLCDQRRGDLERDARDFSTCSKAVDGIVVRQLAGAIDRAQQIATLLKADQACHLPAYRFVLWQRKSARNIARPSHFKLRHRDFALVDFCARSMRHA